MKVCNYVFLVEYFVMFRYYYIFLSVEVNIFSFLLFNLLFMINFIFFIKNSRVIFFCCIVVFGDIFSLNNIDYLVFVVFFCLCSVVFIISYDFVLFIISVVFSDLFYCCYVVELILSIYVSFG